MGRGEAATAVGMGRGEEPIAVVAADRGCDDGWIDADGEEFLAGEVEREVLVGLEEAELADLLGGDAAGGEVGDAAGVEFDADVGDVDFAGEDGQADGADFADGELARLRTMSRSWIMRSRTTSTSRERGVKMLRRWASKNMGRVSAASVAVTAGLKRSRWPMATMRLCAAGEREDVVGFGEGGGEGLFDEDVEAGKKKLLSDGSVMAGGDADGGGVERQIRVDEFGHGCEGQTL